MPPDDQTFSFNAQLKIAFFPVRSLGDWRLESKLRKSSYSHATQAVMHDASSLVLHSCCCLVTADTFSQCRMHLFVCKSACVHVCVCVCIRDTLPSEMFIAIAWMLASTLQSVSCLMSSPDTEAPRQNRSSDQDDISDDFDETKSSIQRQNSRVAQTVKSMEHQSEHLRDILRRLRTKMRTPGPMGEY